MKNHHAVLLIIAVLGTLQICMGSYLLSRDKVAPTPQKYACEVLSNGQVHSFNVDGENVKLVRVD